MLTLKTNNNKQELIASHDIDFGTLILSCKWDDKSTSNSFYIPKTKIRIQDDDHGVPLDELFIPVSLEGFGAYIKPSDKKPNTKAIIDFDNCLVKFFSIRKINKNDEITYCLDFTNIPNVKIQ